MQDNFYFASKKKKFYFCKAKEKADKVAGGDETGQKE